MKREKPTYEELEERNQLLERKLKNVKDYAHIVQWASLPITRSEIGWALEKILRKV